MPNTQLRKPQFRLLQRDFCRLLFAQVHAGLHRAPEVHIGGYALKSRDLIKPVVEGVRLPRNQGRFELKLPSRTSSVKVLI